MDLFIDTLLSLGAATEQEGLDLVKAQLQHTTTEMAVFDEMMRTSQVTMDAFEVVQVNGVNLSEISVAAARGDLKGLAKLMKYTKPISESEVSQYARLVGNNVYSAQFKIEARTLEAARLRPDLDLAPDAVFSPQAKRDINMVNERIKAKLGEKFAVLGINVVVGGIAVGILEYLTEQSKGLWVLKQGGSRRRIALQSCFPTVNTEDNYDASKWYNVALITANLVSLADNNQYKIELANLLKTTPDLLQKHLMANFVTSYSEIAKFVKELVIRNVFIIPELPERCHLLDPITGFKSDTCIVWDQTANVTSMEYLNPQFLPPKHTTICIQNPTILSTLMALVAEIGEDVIDGLIPVIKPVSNIILWVLGGVGIIGILYIFIMLITHHVKNDQNQYAQYAPIYENSANSANI